MDGVQKFPYRKFFNGTKRPNLHNSFCTTTSTADNRSKPTYIRAQKITYDRGSTTLVLTG
ncbi:hypothetical protein ALC62_14590 [Cyphomyrmex costatus]|uniref:Uncharacterized protein n=1 Tax=Cyphomyrmex costatus TaxID=456900 RepID=A0A195C2A5_9HYME|nr:hypothetical protein ALC62_14590 [Cyphomyrmex costatus]